MADPWWLYIGLVALGLFGLKWCRSQRRRYIQRQRLQRTSSSSSTSRITAPLSPEERTLLAMGYSLQPPPPPATYTTVWLHGHLAYLTLPPHHSSLHVDQPPPYQPYAPGVAALAAPFPSAYSSAVAAAPVDYSAAPPSYRLTDKDGAGPVPPHARLATASAALASAAAAGDAGTDSTQETEATAVRTDARVSIDVT